MIVRFGGRFEGHVGGHHHPDLLANVVEGEHFVEKEQAGVGNTEFVCGLLRQTFDLADCVISEITNGAGSEGGKAGQARGLVAAERVAQRGENVAFHVGGAPSLGDGSATGRERQCACRARDR